MVSEFAAEAPIRQRRRIPACLRCRQRKTKCNNKVPVCSNCERAGVSCDHDGAIDKVRADQFQSRVAYLEDLLKQHAPHVHPEILGGTLQTPGQGPRIAETALENSEIDTTNTANARRDQVLVDNNALPRRDDGAHSNAQQPSLGRGSTEEGPASQQTYPSPRHATTDRHHITTQSDPGLEAAASTGSTTGSRIGPEQPLAHDVGLLSLGNTGSDPKYLGPSSGVSFARLIYAAAPQTQGLTAATPPDPSQRPNASNKPAVCIPLPKAAQMYRFAESYFDTFDHMYPFLRESWVRDTIERNCVNSVMSQTRGDLDLTVLFLVAALGARSLEQGLDADLRSGGYLASAMAEVGHVPLHDSLKGVQVMLLLVLASLWFPNGLNAWYLEATIIASCLDLGLQRRRPADMTGRATQTSTEEDDERSSIFWTAYSIERVISTTLGRPLTLRDEAIDVEFPGETGTQYSSYPATVIPSPLNDLEFFNVQSYTNAQQSSRPVGYTEPVKRTRTENAPSADYAASRFCFRFDRITAEIKLMLYRVVQLPTRFPWPTDLRGWQGEAHEACNSLLDTANHILSSRKISSPRARRALPAIELKYHQCILLLFRPSPAFRSPSADALAICHMSALEVIRVHSNQLRLGELADTWLTAHTVFISGITIIYTAWVLPKINNRAAVPGARNYSTLNLSVTEAIKNGLKGCSDLLAHLGQTWSVARDAKAKFDEMSVSTLDRIRTGSLPFASASEQDSNLRSVGIQGAEASIGAIVPSTVAEATNNTFDALNAGNNNASWMAAGDAFTFGDLLDPPDFLEQLGDFSASYDFDWMADSNALL